jgi:hypothetical protein
MAMKSLEHAMKTPGLDFIDFRFFEGIKAKVIAPIISLFLAVGAAIYGSGPNTENPGGLIGDVANGVKDVFTGGGSTAGESKSGSTNSPRASKSGSPDMASMMNQLSGKSITPNPKGAKNSSVPFKGIKSRDALREQERMRHLREESTNQQSQIHPANQRMPGQP